MVKLIHLFPETTRALCIFILPQFLTLNFFSQFPKFLRKFLLSTFPISHQIDTSTSTANPPPRSLLINASITALCSAVSSFSLYSLRRRFLRDSPLTLRRGVVVHRISLFTV
ncbi:hypothetical protein QL285_070666 [Trifolium repens]|nr:hypothetical protein QL285_070666 [Trifolium repens]